MLVYNIEFIKKTGEKRKMRFVKISDMPKEFIKEHLKGGTKKNLQDGMEVVWDLDKNDFRIVNWKSILGNPKIVNENINFKK